MTSLNTEASGGGAPGIPAMSLPTPGLLQLATTSFSAAPPPTAVPTTALQPLSAEQKLHWERLHGISTFSVIILDKSDTGQGKSYGAMDLAIFLGAVVLVICPPDIMSKWKKILNENKVPSYGVYSYNTARVQRGRLKTDVAISVPGTEDEKTGAPKVAWGSIQFNNWLQDSTTTNGPKRRMLLIVDEYHNAKNADTANAILIRGIIRNLREYNKSIGSRTDIKSARCLLLSATPFDKETHAQGMLRLFGCFSADRLYEKNPQGQFTSTEGWEQLVKYSQSLANVPFFKARLKPDDIQWVNSLNPTVPYSSASTMAWNISTRIIDPAISSYMLSEDHKITYNYFVKVATDEEARDPRTAETVKKIKKDIDDTLAEIASIIGFKDDESNSVNNKGVLARLTGPFRNLEIYKSNLFQRTAYNILTTVPHSKVIIMLNYIEPIDSIAYWFSVNTNFIPNVIKGSVDPTERDNRIAQFQASNDDSRLLICNVQIVKEGRDMHDTSPGGKFPRFMLISPSYAMIPSVQAMGRIDRLGLTSTPNVRFIYTHTATPEIRIISSLVKKGKVLGAHRGITAEQLESKGTTSSRKSGSKSARSDISSLNESTGDDEETTAEVGSRSNPLPGNFMCQVEGYIDPESKYLKVVSVDDARRFLLRYYGMSVAESEQIVAQSGLADVGVKSGRKKPTKAESKKTSNIPAGSAALTVSLKKPEPVYAPPQAFVMPQMTIPLPRPQQVPATTFSAVPTGFVQQQYVPQQQQQQYVPQQQQQPYVPQQQQQQQYAPQQQHVPQQQQQQQQQQFVGQSSGRTVFVAPQASQQQIPAAQYAPAQPSVFLPPSFVPSQPAVQQPSPFLPPSFVPSQPAVQQGGPVSFIPQNFIPPQPAVQQALQPSFLPAAFLPPQASSGAIAPSGAVIQSLNTQALPTAFMPPPALPPLAGQMSQRTLAGLNPQVSASTNI